MCSVKDMTLAKKMAEKTIKILILCSFESTYVLQLYTYMKKYYPHIRYSILTMESAEAYYREHLNLEAEEEIYSFGAHDYLCYLEAKKLPHFNIIHSLWMEQFWGEAAGVLCKKCDSWFCSVGGSDLYRQSANVFFKYLQKRIIKRADWISSESEETREYFEKVYHAKKYGTPHSIIRFGVDILNAFEKLCSADVEDIKDKYGIPRGKIVIMCGTNAKHEHQHMKIIDAVEKLPKEVLGKCCLLIPMTYGGTDEYQESVRKKAAEVINDSVILQRFLSTDEMAEIATATDIMIHVQTTDQLSSAMLSHMYCGNVVIAGSWLPYDNLRNNGIEFISIDNICELTEQLKRVIPDIKQWKNLCKKNADVVYNLSSWERCAQEWYHVYDQLINRN